LPRLYVKKTAADKLESAKATSFAGRGPGRSRGTGAVRSWIGGIPAFRRDFEMSRKRDQHGEENHNLGEKEAKIQISEKTVDSLSRNPYPYASTQAALVGSLP